MELRRLGRSELRIAPVVLGGNVFGWNVDQPTANRMFDTFVDAGFNAIDTADVYSSWIPGHVGGESERVIGEWLKTSGKRDKVVIMTKLGVEMGPGKKGLSRRYMHEAIEASLSRLQTDYVDLYQSHRDDEETSLDETLSSYAELIKAGKVRAIGASNYSAARFALALETSERNGLARYESLQPLYNLFDRAVFEDALQPLCVQNQVGVISFYALAAGFLTGKYRNTADAVKSARGANVVKKYVNPRGLKILQALDTVARRRNTRPGVVAVAWLLTRQGVTSPIASATSLDQLADLVAATRLQLDPAEIEALGEASQETG